MFCIWFEMLVSRFFIEWKCRSRPWICFFVLFFKISGFVYNDQFILPPILGVCSTLLRSASSCSCVHALLWNCSCAILFSWWVNHLRFSKRLSCLFSFIWSTTGLFSGFAKNVSATILCPFTVFDGRLCFPPVWRVLPFCLKP